MSKSYNISKHAVMKAYTVLKENYSSAGIDLESFKAFDADMKNNLYKLWNRMSSGTYFPPTVKFMKKSIRRNLGAMGVADRIAQLTARYYFDPIVDPCFHKDSYGSRKGKTISGAVGVITQRCRKYDWVLKLQVLKIDETIDHNLLMRAVRKHAPYPWIELYIQRWIKIRYRMPDSSITVEEKGLLKGGSMYPLLVNLYLHYALDSWMVREHPEIEFVRQMDTLIIHGTSEQCLQELREEIRVRLEECSLLLHPQVSLIYCCRDGCDAAEPFEFCGSNIIPQEAEQ